MNTRQFSVQVVWCHPRTDSLTATVVDEVLAALQQHQDVTVDVLDLYRSDFDPVLFPFDEPDWPNPAKQYSEQVHELAQRTLQADAIIFIFPLWWYSVPAMLKGYIDRVWNYGLLYSRPEPHNVQAVRWVSLSGFSRAKLQKRHYDSMIEHHLNIGIAQYCGIEDSQVTLLCDTLGEEAHDYSVLVEEHKNTARKMVKELLADRAVAVS